MDGPYIRVEDSGLTMPLREDVTTIGRGRSVDVVTRTSLAANEAFARNVPGGTY